MRKTRWLGVVMLCGLVSGLLHAGTQEDVIKKAKLLLFDRQWDRAGDLLQKFIEDHPKSEYLPLALFYSAKSMEEQGKTLEALVRYGDFLKVSKNVALIQEARLALINLSFLRYQRGDPGYLRNVLDPLRHEDSTVRYYAAFKLSYAKDRKLAFRAVPVLKRLLETEDDDELRDRAKLALMRIDPDLLRDLPERRIREATLMHFEIYDKNLKKITFSLTIPFAFARLALESIPDKEKRSLRRKGYDLDRMLKVVMQKRELIKIDEDDSRIKVWVE